MADLSKDNTSKEEVDTIIQGLEYQNELVKQRFKLREQELLDALKEKDNEISDLRRRTFNLVEESQRNTVTSHSCSCRTDNNYEDFLEKKCQEYEIELKGLKYQFEIMRESKEKLLKNCDELSYRIIDSDRELDNLKKYCSQLQDELGATKEINLKLKEELLFYKNEKDNQDLEFISKKVSIKNDNRKIITEKGKEKVSGRNVTTSSTIAEAELENSIKEVHFIFNDFRSQINSMMNKYKSSLMHEIESPLSEITKNVHEMCIHENESIQTSIQKSKNRQEEIKQEIDSLNESNEKILKSLKSLRQFSDAAVKFETEMGLKEPSVATVSATLTEDSKENLGELNREASAETTAQAVIAKGGSSGIARPQKSKKKVLVENQNQQLQNNDVSSFAGEITTIPAAESTKITTKRSRVAKARKNDDSGKTDDNDSIENQITIGGRAKIRNDGNENLTPRRGLRPRKN